MRFCHRNTILTVFPNPVDEQLNYRLEVTRPTNHRIDLFSPDGRHLINLATGRIAPGNYSESYRLPADFPAGTFFLVLRSDDAMQSIKISRH